MKTVQTAAFESNSCGKINPKKSPSNPSLYWTILVVRMWAMITGVSLFFAIIFICTLTSLFFKYASCLLHMTFHLLYNKVQISLKNVPIVYLSDWYLLWLLLCKYRHWLVDMFLSNETEPQLCMARYSVQSSVHSQFSMCRWSVCHYLHKIESQFRSERCCTLHCM